MVMTTRQDFARSASVAGVSHSVSAANFFTASAEASKTESLYPAPARRRAIGPPILPRPIKPIRSGGAILFAIFGEDLVRGAETVDGGGNATINSGVQQNLGDLLLAEAVVQRTAHMGFDLMGAAERGQHG